MSSKDELMLWTVILTISEADRQKNIPMIYFSKGYFHCFQGLVSGFSLFHLNIASSSHDFQAAISCSFFSPGRFDHHHQGIITPSLCGIPPDPSLKELIQTEQVLPITIRLISSFSVNTRSTLDTPYKTTAHNIKPFTLKKWKKKLVHLEWILCNVMQK